MHRITQASTSQAPRQPNRLERNHGAPWSDRHADASDLRKRGLKPPVEDGCGEGCERAEAGVGLVQPQAEAAEVFEAVERVLDDMPGAVKDRVVPVLHEAVAPGRDAYADAAPAPVFARLVAVVALVAHDRERLQPRRQRLGLLAVALLPLRGQLPADKAQAVNRVVDLGGQPAPAAADGLLPAAAGASGGPVALDGCAVDVQHVRGGNRLRARLSAGRRCPAWPSGGSGAWLPSQTEPGRPARPRSG